MQGNRAPLALRAVALAGLFALACHAPTAPPEVAPGTLDSAGALEPVLAIGYSNTAALADAYIAAGGNMVNGAESGCGVDRWLRRNGGCWKAARAASSGHEIRTIWVQMSHNRNGESLDDLTAACSGVLDRLAAEFPSVERIYVSGSLYAGHARARQRQPHEPYAEGTWAALAPCIEAHPIAEPGPYLWDSSWPRSYFRGDGIHPSPEGAAAAVSILAAFPW